MKRTFLIILLALTACTAMAQKVTIKKGGSLKQVDGYTMEQYRQCIDNDRLPVLDIIPDGKVSKKEKDYDIVGFCAYCDNAYNAFVVANGSKYYVLTREDVVDASALDAWNESIETRHRALLDDARAAANAYIGMLDAQYSQAKDSVDTYNKAKEIATSRAEKYRDSVTRAARITYDSLLLAQEEINQKSYDKWRQGLSASTRAAMEKVFILSGGLSEPNIAGGCDATIAYANRTDDVIKYISWTGRVKNAVGDYVRNEISGESTLRARLTGPIEPGEVSSATWDCIIYNVTAYELVLTSATVTFMNGKVLNLSQADLKAMEAMPSNRTDIAETANEDFSTTVAAAQREYNKIIENGEIKSIKVRLNRYTTLVNTVENHGSKAIPTYLVKQVYEDLYSAYYKIGKTRANLQDFEKRYKMTIQDPAKEIFSEYDNKVIKK